MFWLASLASNLGTWIHDVGASWLMTELSDSPLMVSAVRTAIALPMMLLAIPAGAIADRFDRRRFMIVTQCFLLSVAGTMAALAWSQRVAPLGLLGLTILMGVGMVLHVPSWQASTPELVDRRLIPQAVALGSISFNLARSVGPAVGGFLVGTLGAWAAFSVNAVSFAGVLVVLILWRRTPPPAGEPEPFRRFLSGGMRFVARDQTMRNVLARVFLFVLPASALWSQLPLIARQQLDWNSRGYGLMICGLGLGAVIGAFVIDLARQRFGSDRVLVTACVVMAVLMGAAGLLTSRLLMVSLMIVLGMCWMTVLTTLNATAQMTLPQPLRARGMACYLSALAFAMAGGSILWGQVAEATRPGISLLVAAGLMLLTTLGGYQLTIGSSLTDDDADTA